MADEELGLFGEDPAFVEPAPAPVEAPPPAPEKPVEPAPAEAPKGEKADAPPASGPARDPETGKFAKRDDEHNVPLSAMLSERDRRQAAENRVRELEAAKAATPPADIWADPDAYVKSKLAEFEPALLGKAELAAKEHFFRYTESSAIARHSNDDVKYEAARDAFVNVARNDPLMTAKLREAPDPGEFIYQQGKIAMQLAEVGGDLAAYRTKIETEARQKWETEAAAREKRNAGIPVSLNQEPSKGAGVVGGTWAGPTPDDQLFPNR